VEVVATRLDVMDGRPVSRTSFVIRAPVDALPAQVRVTANARVILAGGRTENPEDRPEGAVTPEIVGWEGPDIFDSTGGTVAHATLRLAADASWTVISTVVPDALADVAFSLDDA
jgi:hypothetical protein